MGAEPFASRGADSCPAWREVVCAALVDIAVDGEIALGGGFGMAGAGCGSRRSDAAWALVAVLFPAVLGTPELGALAGGGGGWVVGMEAAAGLGGASRGTESFKALSVAVAAPVAMGAGRACPWGAAPWTLGADCAAGGWGSRGSESG